MTSPTLSKDADRADKKMAMFCAAIDLALVDLPDAKRQRLADLVVKAVDAGIDYGRATPDFDPDAEEAADAS